MTPVGGLPVCLDFGADLRRPRGEQFFARHLEEAHRVLVALDEPPEVHVQDDEHLRGVLDQRAVAGLAFADGRFGELAIGGVAQAGDVDMPVVEPDLAHAEFGVEQRAVAPASACLARGEVDLRVLQVF